MLRLLTWAVDYFGVRAGDMHAAVDPSEHPGWTMFHLFGGLVAGATACQFPAEVTNPYQWARFVRRAGITQWSSPAGVLEQLAAADAVAPGGFESLRQLIWWGTIAPKTLAYFRARLGSARLTAILDCPEATMVAGYCSFDPAPYGHEGGPVWTPGPGCELQVLNQDRQPVALGDAGVLHVAGPSLSPGYWKNADATVKRFSRWQGGEGAARSFSTGLWARLGSRGVMQAGQALEEQTA
jgi:acyl-coenzyme A synthetase/AMP-(fatty) acid ligase